MSRTFRAAGDAIQATFQLVEIELLRSLPAQLAETLQYADSDDPVMRRLFPPAVLADPELAADEDLRMREREFADELLATRLEALDTVLALLERGTPHRGGGLRVELTDDEPLLLLGVLNDIRLAVGARIDVEALDRETIPDDAPVAYQLAVMDHLGWWQEQLLALIDPPSSAAADG